MVSLSGLSQRRTPAFIAVLAILMLFIAPEVSKTLAQWRAANAIMGHGERADSASEDSMQAGGMSDGTVAGHSIAGHDTHYGAAYDESMPMHHMAGMPASGMVHHAMPDVSTENTAKKSTSMMDHSSSQPAAGGMATMDDLACGYCELLVHFPFMIWVLIPLLWLLCTSTRAPPVRLVVSFFATFLPGCCLPRAPPAH